MSNNLIVTAFMVAWLLNPLASIAQQFPPRAASAQSAAMALPNKKLDFGTILSESAGKNLDVSRKQNLRRSLQIDFHDDANESAIKNERPLSPSTLFKSGGADAGGGGDWDKIYAEEYPKREFLSQALQMTYETILNAHYTNTFKAMLVEELQNLAEGNKFKYIPSLFFIEQSLPGLQYSQRQLTEEFGSLGGFTTFKPKAFVFLSARTLNYSVEQLSQLVLHEVVHHVLDYSLTTNEEIVKGITFSIFNKSLDEKTNESMIRPQVFQNGRDSSCRLTDPIAAEKTVHLIIDLFSPYKLSEYEATNSFGKIRDFKFTDLAIVFKEQMWFRVNLELSKCGFLQVSVRNQGQALSASDLMSLVVAKMYRQKQATFVRISSELEEKNTGIISQITNVRVD